MVFFTDFTYLTGKKSNFLMPVLYIIYVAAMNDYIKSVHFVIQRSRLWRK